jgi:catechol 2,3-dioxygenase-like lactoylglutathione lyase family enzyme
MLDRTAVVATVALIVASSPNSIRAQAPSPSRVLIVMANAPALGDVRGAFVALSVADLAASKRWYVEKLGLQPTMELPPTNGAAVVVLEGGGLTVELIRLDSAVKPTRSPETVHGIFKAGVVVDSLDAVLATLRARGVEIAFGPYPARGGQRANAIIRDNGGNLIQLFGRRP